MKDGTSIRICDMEDSHLVNTLRFLKKQAQKACKFINDKYKTEIGVEVLKIEERVIWEPHVTSVFYQMELDAERRGLSDWDKDTIPYNHGKEKNGLILDDWNGVRNRIRVTNKFKLMRFD
ncbi:unnamed protein product [marine sediment metagenome]|uniref:Uncharacterized protein n=1 Tax=marine sediment metagenome TaxID=412755 RepID=X1U4K3_9ZZZZ